MAEEQEKKQKPKATLIKHPVKREPGAGAPAGAPPSAADAAEKVEKKKVVVIKRRPAKKVRVVTTREPEEKQSTPSQADTAAPPSRPQPEQEVRPERPAQPSDIAPKQPTPGPGRPAEGQGRPAEGPRRPTEGPRRPANDPQMRSGDRRPSGPPRQGGGGTRPPGQQRPGGYRPSGPPRQGGGGGGYRGNDRQGGGGYRGNDRPGGPPRQGGGGGFRPGGPPRQGGSGYRPGGPPRQGGGGYRPGGPPRQGGGGYRPGGPPRQGGGGYRPGGPPRQGAGKGKPEDRPPQGKAPAGKKFLKSKKKGAYQKTRKDQEREFQIKKKTVQMSNPVPKEIDIMEFITVSDLAKKMNLKASELISKLMGMGQMVTMNQQIDAETAEIIAGEYDCKVKIVSLYDETIIEVEKDEEADLVKRMPIVTVMGHVDHGKTQLLDTIRSAHVVDGEHGGITQHIGAYKVEIKGQNIVFLDTPGHEAFTLMRARGAQVTDIVVLVVAANDGVMPQTIEAISHAKEAGVPIIVAVNKMDLPEANPENVKSQLSNYELMPEDWGGTTLFNYVSALKGDGVDGLLDNILLQADILELKANYDCRAEGVVIESQVDHGRGIVGTVIIQRGTLKVGDAFIAGIYPGKVRAMFDDRGRRIEEAPPATPVEILGFTGVPNAGAPFQATESEKVARQVGVKRQELERQGEAQNVQKITLDNLYDSIQQGEIQELKVVIKGDVHGSVEALQSTLTKLSTDEIKLIVIQASAGAIIESDVNLASASNAIIIGFHVRPTPKAQSRADEEKVEIRKYNIIYDAVEDIRNAMEGMLSPELREKTVGNVEVRDTFKVPRIGLIAGCYVTQGTVKRNSSVRVVRDGVVVHEGIISSLRRFKDDAREVESGYECGIGIEGFIDMRVGDQIEVFEVQEFAKTMSPSK